MSQATAKQIGECRKGLIPRSKAAGGVDYDILGKSSFTVG